MMASKNPRAGQGARAGMSIATGSSSHSTKTPRRPILRAPQGARLRLDAILWTWRQEAAHHG
jgi:hypothetical protein